MRAWSDCSDAELLAATRDEPEAFAAFYRRHARVVLAGASRRLRDGELAADVTAETFAAALVASDRFDASRGSARAWLFGILARQIGTALRRGAAETRARRRLGIEPVEVDSDQVAWIEALGADDDGRRAMRLLDELPDGDRAIVHGRVIAGRGYRELATELGVPEATVRKRVSRALAALRGRLMEGGVTP